MSKIQASKNLPSNEKKKSREWPFVVYLWAAGLAILGYTLANLGILPLPHAYHWTTGIIGGVIGVIIGWLWYRWRGDVL